MMFHHLPKSLRYFSAAAASKKTVLVVGSSGALGSVVAKHLSSSEHMIVLGADVVELPTDFTGDWEVNECTRHRVYMFDVWNRREGCVSFRDT
jgi:NAD(P)-dependent dehydrogenase (short-subunit alcohol dehydrogenase family)